MSLYFAWICYFSSDLFWLYFESRNVWQIGNKGKIWSFSTDSLRTFHFDQCFKWSIRSHFLPRNSDLGVEREGGGEGACPQISPLFAMGVGIFLSQPAGGLTGIPSSQLLAPGDSCGLISSANTFKELAVDMKWAGRRALSKHREIVERE